MTHGVFMRCLFTAGEYGVGALTGAVTGASVRAVVTPEWDMALAMLAGMGLGMVVHVVVLALCGPILGMFQVMVTTGLIGTYGGMIFAMRDAMLHARGEGCGLLVGAVFGAVVVAAVRVYDRSLHAAA